MPHSSPPSPSPSEFPTLHIPTIDISPYLSSPSSSAARSLIHSVREACTTTGFFQLIGHGIPSSLQNEVFTASEKLFRLPMEEKLKLDRGKSVGASNRGYELIGGQGLQEGTLPDLKEVGLIPSVTISFFQPLLISLAILNIAWNVLSSGERERKGERKKEKEKRANSGNMNRDSTSVKTFQPLTRVFNPTLS
jgi:hypothetical protein